MKGIEVEVEVRGELGGVPGGPADEARPAAAQDVEPQHVHAGSTADDAAVVADPAAVVEHGQVDPAVIRAVAGGPDHGADARRAGGRSRSVGDGMRVGAKRSGRSTSSSMPALVAHSSKVASSRFILRSASAHVLGNDPENWATPSRSRPSRPTIRTPAITQRVEVDRAPLRRADQLGRGEMAGADDVVELVVPLVEDAGRVGPPEDVAAAVASAAS